MTLSCSSDTVAVNLVLRAQNEVKGNLVFSNFVLLSTGYDISVLKSLPRKYVVRKLLFSRSYWCPDVASM